MCVCVCVCVFVYVCVYVLGCTQQHTKQRCRYDSPSGRPAIYRLKYDRIQLVGRARANSSSTPSAAAAVPTTPFLQLASPYYNGTTRAVLSQIAGGGGKSLSETCSAAVPNTLDFAGSQNFTLDMWTYPRDSGMQVDLGWCVAAFFFLSFFFQVCFIWGDALFQFFTPFD